MYRNIIVGTDGSDTAALAVRHAADLAKISGARLHLVRAYSSPAIVNALGAEAALVVTVDIARLAADQPEHAARELNRLASDLQQQRLTVDTYCGAGDAARFIVDVAITQKADLIVVGNKGMTGARRLLGSVPNKIAHNAPCNVMIVYTT